MHKDDSQIPLLPVDEPEVNAESEHAPADAPPPANGSEIQARMEKIKWELIHKVGALNEFAQTIGNIIRDAVDYVIDAPTMRRYSIDELESDEKTTIGKRIERLLRINLDLPKGKKLDIKLGGEDVDIKTTMRNTWMFAPNNYGHVNLLIKYDEKKACYSLGLAYVVEDGLNVPNRDGKRGSGKKVRENIMWLLKDQSYPPNFLAHLSESTLSNITKERTGMKRVKMLLSTVTGIPIPRHVICSIANQKDPLRRIRSNGGARDLLWAEGILVLSGAYECDRIVARAMNQPELGDDETLTFLAANVSQEMLRLYCREHQLQETQTDINS